MTDGVNSWVYSAFCHTCDVLLGSGGTFERATVETIGLRHFDQNPEHRVVVSHGDRVVAVFKP